MKQTHSCDRAHQADVRLELVRDAATMRRSANVRTPDGQAVTELVLANRSGAVRSGRLHLRFISEGGLQPGKSYELSFLCKSTSSGVLQEAKTCVLPERPRTIRVCRGWQDFALVFTAGPEGTAACKIPGLVLAKFSAPATVYFGPVRLRELPPTVPLGQNWRLFLNVLAPQTFLSIPATLAGKRGATKPQTVALQDNQLNLGALAGNFTARDCAVLYNEFNCPRAGVVQVGVAADWWLELFVNGAKVHSTVVDGNGSADCSTLDHVVQFPVKAGRNLLAVKVLSGSKGWRVVCGAPAGIRARALELSAVLEPFMDQGQQAGGVVLVASKDRILATEARGYADLVAKKRMRPESMFWIASQTKCVTGTAFMMLVDENKVKLDDPVEQYLPEFKGQMVIAEQDEQHILLKKPVRPVSMRDLLSHTSGLPFSTSVETPLDRLPLHIAARSYGSCPLQTEPGTVYCYSNAGINAAGRVIEVVSGLPYETFVQQRLFDPLGMTDTTFWPNAEQGKRLAKAYHAENGKTLKEMGLEIFTHPLSARSRQAMPAGGLFSTARDVARFCQMILNHGTFAGQRYLSKAALQEMTRRQTPDDSPVNYGLGWGVGAKISGGGAYSTFMEIDFQRGLIAVFMVQQQGGVMAGDALRQWVRENGGALL